MASIEETIARAGDEPHDLYLPQPPVAGPPEDLADGLTIEELGTLLAMRAQRAWFQGIEAGRAAARRDEKERRAAMLDDLAQRLTLEHLAASAPLADAIQKARKAADAAETAARTSVRNESGPKAHQRRIAAAGEAARALTECADAYAKFTSGLSSGLSS